MRSGWGLVLATACGACGGAPPRMAPREVRQEPAPFFAPGTDLRWLSRPTPPESVAARTGECAPDTWWDGSVCTHARATCGSWDGATCEPKPVDPKVESALHAELARIDAEARALCPVDDQGAQLYSGTAPDVLKAVDAAVRGAAAIDRRLEELRARASSPNWSVATLVRAGSVYDCISSSLANAAPSYFTAQQQDKLNKLMLLAATQPANQGSPLQQSVQDTIQQVKQKWLETRDRYLDVLAAKVVVRYATAALLARRFAIEGFAFTRAAQRLSDVAAALGPERMKAILEAMPDPTDPTGLGHVRYFEGAFNP
jgi:hypothetical protein